ncbi:MAG: hypothetical protein LBU32_25940 [Clostridiales bacterium]|nr:hypothetical protein [Clostridiales bacterium]
MNASLIGQLESKAKNLEEAAEEWRMDAEAAKGLASEAADNDVEIARPQQGLMGGRLEKASLDGERAALEAKAACAR